MNNKQKILLIALVLCFTGCNRSLNKPVEDTRTKETQTATDKPAEQTPSPAPTTEPTAEPTPEPTPEPKATDEPIVTSTDAVDIILPDSVESPYNLSYGNANDDTGVLSNKSLGWYFNRNKEHQPPTAQREFDIRVFDSYYLGDISSKVVYLTFDHGYENGFTETILDILKEKDVKATFFVTKTYIRDNQELVKRSVEEGHIIGNHSVSHPSFPEISDEEIAYEINETARYYQEITGQEMPCFFRPPKGEYSARTLSLTQELGYKTIFWSFAYEDWLIDNQPGKDYTYKIVMDNLHNGEIFLLHAVSQSNTEALPDIIDGIRAEGYEFKTLYDLK